ncbi:GAF and ANTAR domain-containing protein [Cellulomonas endometrii]|uniref:GAF and ANTAR domain-containing protein n=1 Tax=Cellulomonas endometrii TaxID=3036301 RepID=UPI0024AE5866|nr:GAF and ANTAR domain-containing protein [Cellulomonas endometrii]
MAEVCDVWPGTEPARSVQALLDDLVEIVAGRTGSGVEASAWARRRGTDWLITSSGERADRCDAVVVGSDGPWRAVLDTATPVVVPDLRASQEWHAWRRTALGEGFGCVVAVPAPLARGGHAALSLYLEEPGSSGPEVVRRVDGLAQQIASLIDLHSTIPAREPVPPASAATRRTRASVQHAVGVLMEMRGCDEGEARRVLGALQRAQGRPLDVVAAAVVARTVHEVGGRPVPAAD